MSDPEETYVQKACAYVTRESGELLVFEGPGHAGLQVPKGTVEADETPREAVFREIAEETGLGLVASVTRLACDLWRRRRSPPRWYVRYFYHATVHEPRDRWTHTVTDGGAEHGADFEFSWVTDPASRTFALDLDEYLYLLPGQAGRTPVPPPD